MIELRETNVLKELFLLQQLHLIIRERFKQTELMNLNNYILY